MLKKLVKIVCTAIVVMFVACSSEPDASKVTLPRHDSVAPKIVDTTSSTAVKKEKPVKVQPIEEKKTKVKEYNWLSATQVNSIFRNMPFVITDLFKQYHTDSVCYIQDLIHSDGKKNYRIYFMEGNFFGDNQKYLLAGYSTAEKEIHFVILKQSQNKWCSVYEFKRKSELDYFSLKVEPFRFFDSNADFKPELQLIYSLNVKTVREKYYTFSLKNGEIEAVLR